LSFVNSGNANANSVDSISTPDFAYMLETSAVFLAMLRTLIIIIMIKIRIITTADTSDNVA